LDGLHGWRESDRGECDAGAASTSDGFRFTANGGKILAVIGRGLMDYEPPFERDTHIDNL